MPAIMISRSGCGWSDTPWNNTVATIPAYCAVDICRLCLILAALLWKTARILKTITFGCHLKLRQLKCIFLSKASGLTTVQKWRCTALQFHSHWVCSPINTLFSWDVFLAKPKKYLYTKWDIQRLETYPRVWECTHDTCLYHNQRHLISTVMNHDPTCRR